MELPDVVMLARHAVERGERLPVPSLYEPTVGLCNQGHGVRPGHPRRPVEDADHLACASAPNAASVGMVNDGLCNLGHCAIELALLFGLWAAWPPGALLPVARLVHACGPYAPDLCNAAAAPRCAVQDLPSAPRAAGVRGGTRSPSRSCGRHVAVRRPCRAPRGPQRPRVQPCGLAVRRQALFAAAQPGQGCAAVPVPSGAARIRPCGLAVRRHAFGVAIGIGMLLWLGACASAPPGRALPLFWDVPWHSPGHPRPRRPCRPAVVAAAAGCRAVHACGQGGRDLCPRRAGCWMLARGLRRRRTGRHASRSAVAQAARFQGAHFRRRRRRRPRRGGAQCENTAPAAGLHRRCGGNGGGGGGGRPGEGAT